MKKELKKPSNDGGFVRGCRYYRKGEADGLEFVACRLHGNKANCEYCPTCPVCGGKNYLDTGAYVSGILVRRPDAMTCTICGLRIEVYRSIQKSPDKGRRHIEQLTAAAGKKVCSVHGCNNGVYDRKNWKGNPLCTTHYNRIKSWKSRKFPQERFPFLVAFGKIVENPKYKKMIPGEVN